ncbi:ATP-binding protein [Salipiger mucosus]|uniref:Histidine kinase/HSP90-like ATPase domain-containing protein n=1 Tax=Salipiger mucosus DSM 16094 TaxID=1123237 RepID=S9RN82_9RHOB|nr:ATP-binding protein [Salipiger mucosus]EPX75439.1 hypothetical protein Salmuc_00166 [Salipiger mucosus DSM 16094]
MTIVLEMPPVLGEIDPLVVSLKRELADSLPEEKLSALEIAIAEALTNAVEHGASASVSQPIAVSASSTDLGVTIEIIDAGDQVPHDLYDEVVSLDDIDPLAESGRGLSLIRHLSDKLIFEQRDGRNRLELQFLRAETECR